MKRNDIIDYINNILDAQAVAAADESLNGLQVQGKEDVESIVFSVSASKKLFDYAALKKADMVIVHHGLLWGQPFTVTGLMHGRIAALIKNDINLAAWHLPLDMNDKLGHNISIANTLGLKGIEPFGVYHGVKIGFMGKLPAPGKVGEIAAKLSEELGAKAEPFEFSASVEKVAVISGGGHKMLEQAIEAGADLFITGSRDEFVQELCRESGMSFISLGHYNSEKIGVKALMDNVAKKFKVTCEFVEIENPM
ncbi:dinuclear metal center protein [Parelusimicrobium proximum]|uniref:Nif3-like dinuclear metal center hexameric protein n=1 Tax=Parelusimicrobium proximum TaxID=3228953 RepID=UPI003D181246